MGKRWIVLCCHDASSPPEKVRCFDEYSDALHWAGEYWEERGLNFDRRLKQPFWVDVSSGYFTEVHATMKHGKIRNVSHAEGDGPDITIMPESK